MSRWVVRQRGGNWYVEWTGRGRDTIHDPQSFLTKRRAIAIRDALNGTEEEEMRALLKIWREVAAERAGKS